MKPFGFAIMFLLCASIADAQMVRRPTPPMPSIDIGDLPPAYTEDGDCGPGGCGPGNVCPIAGGADGSSWLPWRNSVEGTLKQQGDTLQQQNQLLQQILANQRAQQNQPPVTAPVEVPTVPDKPEEEAEGGPKTLPGRIADRQADWLAEHGGPISSRIAASASEKLESDSAAVRFVGFTQAKVAVVVFCLAIVLVIGLVVFIIHRLNKRLIPILERAAAATANPIDDKLVAILSRGHERVGSIGDRIKGRFTGGDETQEPPQATP